jgi:hypothetical protein
MNNDDDNDNDYDYDYGYDDDVRTAEMSAPIQSVRSAFSEEL